MDRHIFLLLGVVIVSVDSYAVENAPHHLAGIFVQEEASAKDHFIAGRKEAGESGECSIFEK